MSLVRILLSSLDLVSSPSLLKIALLPRTVVCNFSNPSLNSAGQGRGPFLDPDFETFRFYTRDQDNDWLKEYASKIAQVTSAMMPHVCEQCKAYQNPTHVKVLTCICLLICRRLSFKAAQHCLCGNPCHCPFPHVHSLTHLQTRKHIHTRACVHLLQCHMAWFSGV